MGGSELIEGRRAHRGFRSSHGGSGALMVVPELIWGSGAHIGFGSSYEVPELCNAPMGLFGGWRAHSEHSEHRKLERFMQGARVSARSESPKISQIHQF